MPEPANWLERVPLLRGGRVVRRLSAGISADSWLVDAPTARCVVRVDRPLAARLGLDRSREWDILYAAHAAGLAPRPLARDADQGILVTGWLDADAWKPASLRQPARLERLGRLLRAVHGLPGIGARFDPVAVAQRYARATGEPGLGAAVDEVARLSQDLYPSTGWALCHHDPHAGNLLGLDPTVLIDWEYAAHGQPLFDLAAVIRYHRLGAGRADILLDAWAGGEAAPCRDRMDAFCRLYDALTVLWEKAVTNR